jgi:hypothetical protein
MNNEASFAKVNQKKSHPNKWDGFKIN